ncbi:hypothetical protein BU24DRAFT_411028 [Aaosphaeria arxii CBS 175.79]|uniref:C3H1-type domain-containing protein n=1 Tax=Aaosphaeria arxii CBS 175.79 TaxID=1450172 RepID=A0A6A5XLS6_9PLEO|nr:uncharacterized protein BU24DRAFT_411028 [Aaosphaeria arxii CBS 175.79]KAF2013264.1 hypothetical protein BU24DRAFT_411028 [Aaosphaeria arxii CBS 175.79]
MALPPRQILTEEQIRALTPEERTIAIAEWSSINARLRREQEQRAQRGGYRGATRARGRGRGRGYYGYQPYQTFPPKFNNASANFTAESSTVARPVVTQKAVEAQNSPQTPCPAFTATGVCKRNRCPHIHDPDKTAICKPFLFKGQCPSGEACPLSHNPSANRSPHCIHFQNDSCNKDDCPYAHVHVNAAAPLCEDFARLGFCDKGAQCTNRHALGECPDYTNKGSCHQNNCRLNHVVHAGRLRKAAGANLSGAESPSAPNSPTNKSTSTTPDSEDEHAHALTQQDDFVPFDP